MAASRGRPVYYNLSGAQSPNPVSPSPANIMAPSQVNCHCGACNYKICSMWNAWVKVSKTLFTYEHPAYFKPDKIDVVPETRAASPDSDIADCIVRPVCCGSCKIILGERCVEASEGKFLLNDRTFFQLQRLSLYDIALNQTVAPMIKNERPFGADKAQARSPVVHTRPTSARESVSNGVDSPMMSQPTMTRTHEIPDALTQQRRDIDRILSVLNDNDRRMKAIESSIEALKADQLSGAVRTSRYGASLPKEFEALTDNVSRLNSRVGDLDGLRLEMLVTKRRVKIMEDGLAASSQSSHTVTGHTPLPSQTFTNPSASLNSGVTSSFHSRPIQQATAGRREIPNSGSSTPQIDETPASSSGAAMQLPETQRVAPGSRPNHHRSSVSAESDLYEASPEYRGRKESANEANFRPLAPQAPAFRPSHVLPSSVTIPSTPESFVAGPPHQAPMNQFTTVNRPAATSRRLNDIETVQISDPDDTDFAPDYQKPPSPRPVTRGPRRGEKVRLPTPDWERPGWARPSEDSDQPQSRTLPSDKPSPRRNINNRTAAPSPKRRKTSAIGDDVASRMTFESLPSSWTEGSAYSTQQLPSTIPSTQTHDGFIPSTQTHNGFIPSAGFNGAFQPSPYPTNPHALEPPGRLEEYPRPPKAKSPPPVREKQDLRSVPRTRDAEGRLLRPDGKVDGRSVRYGTPNPKRRSSGVPRSKPTTPVTMAVIDTTTPVTHVNPAAPVAPASAPAPVAVNTPAVGTPVLVDTPPLVITTPAAVNTPPVAAAPIPPSPAVEFAPPAVEPAPPVAEPTPPAAESMPPAAGPTPPAAEPTIPAAEPTAEPTPPASELTPPPAEPTPPAAEPTPLAPSPPPAVATVNASPPAKAAAPKSPRNAAPATRQSSRKMRRSGIGKDRDEEGNLLNSRGKIDGRSLRYKRAKERMEAEREAEAEESGAPNGGDEEGDGRGQLVGVEYI